MVSGRAPAAGEAGCRPLLTRAHRLDWRRRWLSHEGRRRQSPLALITLREQELPVVHADGTSRDHARAPWTFPWHDPPMLLQKTGTSWARVPLTSWNDEAHLQEVLAASPELVPGCAGNAAARELAIIGTGSLDLLLVDDLGTLTLVECKLRKNPQIRREVVGQILAYASGLQRMSYGQVTAAFSKVTQTSLIAAVQEASGGTVDPSQFEQRVGDALADGRFRLVVAVDEITEELKGIIEFLNVHFDDRIAVMALELGLFKQGDVELLVPSHYGAEFATASGDPVKGSQKRWDLDLVRERVEGLSDSPERTLVLSLLSHATKNAAAFKGGVGAAPSGGFYYRLGDKTRSMWSLYVRDAGAVIALNFGSIASASEEAAQAMLLRLQQSDRLKELLPADPGAAFGKYPELPVSVFTDAPSAAHLLMESLDAALAQSSTSPGPGDVSAT